MDRKPSPGGHSIMTHDSSDAREMPLDDPYESIGYRLRERERFLRTLIANLPGIVYRCRTDEEWTTEFVSAEVRLVGYSPQDFVGARHVSWDVIMHPDDRERVRATVRHLVNTNPRFATTTHVVSYRLVTATGEEKHVRDSFRFVHDDEGSAIAIEGVITDITELALTNERVRDSEGRYRLLAENINDLVCLHDPTGTLLYLSPSVERLLGFRPEDLIGTSPCELIHPDDLPRLRDEAHAYLVRGDTSLVAEYRVRRKSGKEIWVKTTVRRVLVEQSGAVRLISCSRDITARKKAQLERAIKEQQRAAAFAGERAARQDAERAREAVERALAAAELARLEAVQANRAKDEFLQMLSHEFRTPLTTIKTAVGVLRHNGDCQEEREQFLEIIATECDRQIDLVMNLLDASRLGEGSFDLKPEPVTLTPVLRSCERSQGSAARLQAQELVSEIDADLPPVRGDANALKRVFSTMIENAVKYSPPGGRTTVTAELAPQEVAIHITDNGRGIRPADLPHIFEKFYRGTNPSDPDTDATSDDTAGPAKPPGVGLGLYLADRLIQALDGRIVVESTMGQGSRFSVYLKVWDDHQLDDGDGYGFREHGLRHD
jgi:PAS domain S-box-containing protein